MRYLPLMLMTILMGVSAQKLGEVYDNFKRSVARMQLKSIGKFIRLDSMSGGQSDLLMGSSTKSVEMSSYLRRHMNGNYGRKHLDPWGQPYSAFYTQDQLILLSNGPDGQIGSSDDVRETIPLRSNY